MYFVVQLPHGLKAQWDVHGGGFINHEIHEIHESLGLGVMRPPTATGGVHAQQRIPNEGSPFRVLRVFRGSTAPWTKSLVGCAWRRFS